MLLSFASDSDGNGVPTRSAMNVFAPWPGSQKEQGVRLGRPRFGSLHTVPEHCYILRQHQKKSQGLPSDFGDAINREAP